MNNRRLDQVEKYRAIIELIQTCPDKSVTIIEEEPVPAEPATPKKKAGRAKGVGQSVSAADLSAPTETSYYIDTLRAKYRSLNLFKRRWLVHRNNKWGIGLRKRLVPTKHFLKVIGFIGAQQTSIIGRLTEAMMEILRDPDADDPVVFNHLRLVRRWLVEIPLTRLRYESIKWMERPQFDRELRGWVIPFFSFLRMDSDLRERIMTEVERRIRAMEDLRKEEYVEGEPDAYRREKDKRNLEREKQVYEIMMILRSFLPIDPAQDCLLSRRLRERFGVDSLYEFMMAAEEALAFQRPLRREELEAYYGIQPPTVSATAWDYSEDYLVKIGKDPESLSRKNREVIRKQLEPYETVAFLLTVTEGGRSLLFAAAEDLWRYVDRKHYDPKSVYNENFIAFLDALLRYFKLAFFPLIDGSPILFRDMARQEHHGAIFSFSVMQVVCERFSRSLDDLHFFRTGNPTIFVSKDDVAQILAGRGGPLAHLQGMIRSAGESFYYITKALQIPYEMHRRWATGRSGPAADSLIRRPLTEEDLADAGGSRPIPYYDCVVKDLGSDHPLAKDLSGRRLIEDSLRDGLYVRMMAMACQAANECRDEHLRAEMDERKAILAKLESSEK